VISREEIDTSALHKYKICGKHFHSGKSIYLYDVNDPNRLPSLHLGHEKGTVSSGSNDNVTRYECLMNRKKKAINEENF